VSYPAILVHKCTVNNFYTQYLHAVTQQHMCMQIVLLCVHFARKECEVDLTVLYVDGRHEVMVTSHQLTCDTLELVCN